MAETLINSNQIAGATKILNIVEIGSLTRNGEVYSGFSSSNYLQLGNKVDNGYLSLSNAVKDFGAMTETADTWEIVFKIHFRESSSVIQTIFCNIGVDWGSNIVVTHSNNSEGYPNHIRYQFSNTTSGASITGTDLYGITELIDDTDYWFKVEFTGLEYNVYSSTDGLTWTLENTTTNSTKIIKRGTSWAIGVDTTNNWYLDQSSIYIENCYCKANGEYWWKGVEQI